MKDYSTWHSIKSSIEKHWIEKLFHEREIWWCSLGVNIGFEQDGKNSNFERPVLIFRKFNRSIFWGMPLTSKQKEDKFHFKLVAYGEQNGTQNTSYIILSQLRLYSSKRLIRRMSRLNMVSFKQVELKIIELITKKEPQ